MKVQKVSWESLFKREIFKSFGMTTIFWDRKENLSYCQRLTAKPIAILSQNGRLLTSAVVVIL